MRVILSILIAVHVNSAHAQEPVRHVGVFVEPYYHAAADGEGQPTVRVARAFDERLSTNDRERIKEVEAEIRSKPDLITPMTLMVLSIRLYDTGLRDDAVFWHYAAKDRMRTVAQIINGGISGAIVATRDFAATAGETINGYAFCDIAKQQSARRAAFEWVRDNPYKAIFLEQLPSSFTDRTVALKEVVASIESDVQKEADYIADKSNLERFQNARQKSGAFHKYCW